MTNLTEASVTRGRHEWPDHPMHVTTSQVDARLKLRRRMWLDYVGRHREGVAPMPFLHFLGRAS